MKGALKLDIIRSATAGTMESSDTYVELQPSDGGITIEIESVVKEQFGDEIEAAVRDVLKENNVENVALRIVDRGALECVIRARVETAVMRGSEKA